MPNPRLGGVETPVRAVSTKRPHPGARKAAKAPRAALRADKHSGKGVKPPQHGGSPGGGNVADPVSLVRETSAQEPTDYWNRPGPTLGLVREDFQFLAIRDGFDPMVVDSLVESVDWDDSKPLMTGSLKMRESPYGPREFNLRTGDQIALRARDHDGRRKEWWRLNVISPQADYLSGSRTFDLASDMHRLYASIGEFKYVKGSAKPKGWLGHQVVADVCDRYGMAVAAIPRMRCRFTKYGPKESSPIDVIVSVLNKERREHGHHYAIAYEHGRFVIRPFQRTVRMLELGPLLIQAGLTTTIKQNFATAVYMRSVSAADAGTDAKGHKKRKPRAIRATVQDDEAVGRYGLITRMGYAFAESEEELARIGGQHLSIVVNPDRTISASHPGVIGLRRFDAVRVNVEADEDVFDQVLYVDGVRFQIAAGSFNMDLTLSLDDPFVDDPIDKVFDSIDQAQTARGRKPSNKSKAKKKPGAAKKTSKKAVLRTDKKASAPARTAKNTVPKLGGVRTVVKR